MSTRYSRKDYVMTAEVIDKTWTRLLADFGDMWQIRYDMMAVIGGFADVYGDDNPRFDRLRFVKACMKGVSDV